MQICASHLFDFLHFLSKVCLEEHGLQTLLKSLDAADVEEELVGLA